MFSQDKNLPPTFLLNEFDDTELTVELFRGFWGDLFDSLPEGVLILNHAREMLLMNKKLKQLWGYSSLVKTGQESLDQILDQVEDPVGFKARVEEIIDDIHCESQEIIKLKDGRIYQRNTRPLIIGEKNLGRFWTYRDITKEQHTEQALRKSEAKYRTLYRVTQRSTQELALLNRIQNLASEDWELQSMIKALIDSISNTFGYEPAGYYSLQKEFLQLEYHTGYVGNVLHKIPIDQGVTGRTARTKKPILIENVQDDPDFLGSIPNVVSEISVPVFDRDKVIGVLNIDSINGQKLTQADLNLITSLCQQVSNSISRKRLYTKVKTQEERLQNIFEFAPISMAITAPDGSFVRVNRAFETLLGYSQDDLEDLSVSKITFPDDLPKNSGWGQKLTSGEMASYQFEKRYIHKNGSIIDALLKVSLLPTQEGQPVQYIAQIIDLTALKQTERALLQHQKMESIGILAGGIAHDFNNLLVALKAQSSLAMLKLPTQHPARGHIEKAKRAADSASSLTEQLLAYSGQGTFRIEPIDVNFEIQQNTHLLEVAIPKNVQLINKLAPELPKILADKGQVQQILMNLIINGAESLGEQRREVSVTTQQVELDKNDLLLQQFILVPPSAGKFAVITVVDTGHGMDKKTLSKIFDPFFTTKITGRGLGLAAVLGIVKSHNGGLKVSSVKDQGTSFEVYFPIMTNTQYETLAPSLVQQQPNNIKLVDKHKPLKSVLLIDDDESVRETIVDIFQLDHIRVFCAANGDEGILQLQKHKSEIAIVILDLSMPGISPEETFIKLRKIKPELIILLCSGFSKLKVSDFFLDKQYDGFIAKPFDIHNLIDTVQQFLKGQGQSK